MKTDTTRNQARYHITEQDYVQASALFGRLSARQWVFVVGVLALCAALAIGGTTRGLRVLGAFAFIGGLLAWLLVQYVVSPWMLRRHYRSYKAIQDEHTVTLTEQGLRFECLGGVSDLRWDRVYRWRSNRNYVLIYLMPRLYHVVPRRVAQQGFDLAALEDALTRHAGPAK